MKLAPLPSGEGGGGYKTKAWLAASRSHSHPGCFFSLSGDKRSDPEEAKMLMQNRSREEMRTS